MESTSRALWWVWGLLDVLIAFTIRSILKEVSFFSSAETRGEHYTQKTGWVYLFLDTEFTLQIKMWTRYHNKPGTSWWFMALWHTSSTTDSSNCLMYSAEACWSEFNTLPKKMNKIRNAWLNNLQHNLILHSPISILLYLLWQYLKQGWQKLTVVIDFLLALNGFQDNYHSLPWHLFKDVFICLSMDIRLPVDINIFVGNRLLMWIRPLKW